MSTSPTHPVVQLLPCPFCGGHSSKSEHDDECYFTVLNRFREAPPADVSESANLLSAWNRRASPPPVVQGEQPVELPLGEVLVDEDGESWIVDDYGLLIGLAKPGRYYTADHVRAAVLADRDVRPSSIAAGRLPLAQQNSQEKSSFEDQVVPPVQPSGATLSPGAASQWISVGARLPEIGAEVLVFCPTKDRLRVTALARFIPYEGAADYYWDNSYPGKGNMHLSAHVTHWMPLPEPPHQVEQGESSSKGGES